KLNGIAHDGDDLCNKWLANADVPSNNAIQRTLETTLPFQETKRLKVGNDLATVTSLGVQDPTDMVASENVQQADVPVQVPEGSLGQISDKDATAPQDGYVEVVSGTQEGEDYVVKDSLMEEASI
ncbi:PREDICTED: uncharacterized protein LOC109131981, partial [Camelina sativa]